MFSEGRIISIGMLARFWTRREIDDLGKRVNAERSKVLQKMGGEGTRANMNRSAIDRRKILHFNRREKGIMATDADSVECRFGGSQRRELSFDGSVLSITYEKMSSAETCWDKWEGEEDQGEKRSYEIVILAIVKVVARQR